MNNNSCCETSGDIQARYIKGLDSIRIVLAATVAFSHGVGFHFRHYFTKEEFITSFSGKITWLIFNNLYNGQASVIIFFIISGFCIHYPYANGKILDKSAFLASRFVRISLPLSVSLLVGYYMFEIKPLAYMGVWSLICELIYYSIYPLLHDFRKFFKSWIPLYIISFVGMLLIITLAELPLVSHPGRLMDFPVYGTSLTWLIGLPIWISGCHLSEIVFDKNKREISFSEIWLARSFILFVMITFSITKFHGDKIFGFDTPNVITLQVFAFLGFYWLLKEIRWYFLHSPLSGLEFGGKWSYSLYITHPLLIYASSFYTAHFVSNNSQLVVASHAIANTIVVFVFAYVFYLLVERPSHKLAKKISIRLENVRMKFNESSSV